MKNLNRHMGQYLLLSDPGLIRLRLASRALLTMALVCVALVLLHQLVPMTPAAYSIAMISALQGIAAIKETTPAARALTRIYCAVFGFCAIAVLTLIDHSLLLVSGFLLVVIFGATYARCFNARWQAVGMFTFMCVVVGAFLKPHEIDLKSIALAFVVSGVIAHLVRNFVLPERPADDCRRALKVATTLAAYLSDMIANEVRLGWPESGQKKAILLEHQARDAILLCESYLPLERPASNRTHKGRSNTLNEHRNNSKTDSTFRSDALTPSGSFASEQAALMAMRLFNLQLALESVLSSALGPDEIHSGQLSASMQEKTALLASASDEAHDVMATMPEEAFSSVGGDSQKIPLLPRWGEILADHSVRQAFQVTLASAIAMVGGIALSPERWFWAVLTAFLIFSNTRSRGDLYVRALNRAFGTAIGVLIGIGLATLVGGELYLTIILASLSIFAAFYLGALSYSAMTFFITIAIALVYGLIGVFTPALLVLRLEETMIGVAAGIFVSLIVLPLRTTTQARAMMDHFLQALDQFLAAIPAGNDAAQHAELVAAIHRLDTAQADVIAAIGPMQSTWTFGLAQERPRRALIRLSMLTHQAHILAREFAEIAPGAADKTRLGAVREQLAGLLKGGYDMFGRSVIADMAQQPEILASPAKKPADDALEIMAHILRQADQSNQQ